MEDKDLFMNHISNNYEILKRKFRRACKDLALTLTDDIFQDTILKCYESIDKKGKLNDTSAYGIESYFFQSLKMNIKRETQYARNQKRDSNISSDNINDLYEEYSHKNGISHRQKLINDLYKDFSVLYILKQVELNFDDEHFYLFRVKYLVPDMTYKRLQEKTNAKKVRQKVCNVKNWVKENITKETIKKEFQDIYSDILEF